MTCCQERNAPLNLSLYCFKIVFIESSFRMNACRGIKLPMEDGTQMLIDNNQFQIEMGGYV